MTFSDRFLDDCLQSMYRLRRFGIKLGLETIHHLLERLKNPQEDFFIIHIAGTNGKGSIAAGLAAILTRCGYKTGLYTSPHLIRFNERIRIDSCPITDEQVLEAYLAVKKAGRDIGDVTFFEYTTAMAFYAFKHRQVDCAVIETGMGGRLDATNVVNPLLSIISNVSLEHQQYLGYDLAEIAAEKGGIIKPRTPLVTGVRQHEAVRVLKRLAEAQNAPFYRLGEHFSVTTPENGFFNYSGIVYNWPHLRPGLHGRYQIDNAALVLAACELLMPRLQAALEVADTASIFKYIQQGLAEVSWAGRLEWIAGSPPILLDGAHNLNAAGELAHFLSENTDNRDITLVTGILNDKPYDAMLRCWLPLCRRAIVTQSTSERSIPPQTLYESARKLIDDVTIVSNIADALAHAIETAMPNDLICIAGSLYVVGEAKKALKTIA